MAIKDVRKIPTTFRAVQWDYSKEAAEDIKELLDWGNVDGYTYFTDDLSYAEITFTANKMGYQYYLLKAGEWVVVSSKGKGDVLSDSMYTEKYEDND